MNEDLIRRMSLEFGKGSVDLLDLLGHTSLPSAEPNPAPTTNGRCCNEHVIPYNIAHQQQLTMTQPNAELARIFSLAPEAHRNAIVQQIQSMQAFGTNQQPNAGAQPQPNIMAQLMAGGHPPQSAPPGASLPVSSSSLSSNNMPDPFASLGFNSGDWLGAIFNASGSLAALNPDQLGNLAAAAGSAPAQPQTLAKLPVKTATARAVLVPDAMPGPHGPTLTSMPPLHANHESKSPGGARPRRAAAHEAVARTIANLCKPSSEGEEDTPFADFVPGLEGPPAAVKIEGASAGNSTGSDHRGGGANHKVVGGSKRKVEEVDWRTVSDPEDRRRLRRMAKNRRTAAASRERKKAELEDLIAERDLYKGQVVALKAQVKELQQQVVALSGGHGGGGGAR